MILAQTADSTASVVGSSASASNSGLFVFLPLIGAILGGIVGAVGGAWANSWYRDREAKNAEDQERNGLLRLIDAEVYFNEGVLTRFRADPSFVSPATIEALRSNYWDSANARLAQLLPADHIKMLSVYYQYIMLRKTRGKVLEESSGDYSDVARNIDRVINEGKNVRRRGQQYLKDPAFHEGTVEEQLQLPTGLS